MARPIAKDHGNKRRAILASAARVIAEDGLARAETLWMKALERLENAERT